MVERDDAIDKMTDIIHDPHLARALHQSITTALHAPNVFVSGGRAVWDVFEHALKTAIRDIEQHPRGKLLRRLIEYGPFVADDTELPAADDESTLSDLECEQCVKFIFSHMINRFKGELAELLTLEPCLDLVRRLQEDGSLPDGIVLYMGDMVQERRRIEGGTVEPWGSFAKGADGLIVEVAPAPHDSARSELKIHGIIEVKSMIRSKRKLLAQIRHHRDRLRGGVKLDATTWSPEQILLGNPIQIMVIPSTWKLSREWRLVPTGDGEMLELPEPFEAPVPNTIEELQPDAWKIRLAWSQEALNQAAYEMTFWYMSQVGKHIYANKRLPQGWEEMTPEEAGYNAIKMMLYYVMLRKIPERYLRWATKLYNVYSFGYPLGTDSKEMLWPIDFSA